ncbi:MAG: MOSC domain-containing protein [Candidatus Dormibacteraeota bacterium]|nr:MOSC domain-containing protein [Candidatus Dormibacteraeota bacterium]
MAEGRVGWLQVAPVKSTALHAVEEIWLDVDGARGDRRFLLLDDDDHLINGTKLGAVVQVRSDWDEATRSLVLTMPDGESVAGGVAVGDTREVTLYGEQRTVRPVLGRWSDGLSAWAGREVRLVEAASAGAGLDRGRAGGATLLGAASLTALAAEIGVDSLDPRRFRMLVGIDALPAFMEDTWVGKRVAVGDATVLVHGNVGRCVVTTQDPATGAVDLPTLKVLQRFRGPVDTTEPLPFGVWGEVLVAGRVAVGDPCAVVD